MLRTVARPIIFRRLLVAPTALLISLLLAGCAAMPPEPTVGEAAAKPTVEPSNRQAAEAPAFDCATLDELGCLDSTDCTLRQNDDKTYACTTAASECERGFSQRAGRREDCAEGCNFSPGQCYCSPDVVCVCGGGPPAICQAAG